MLDAIDLLHALAGRCSPGHEDNTSCPLLSNNVDDLLRKPLPTSIRVGVGLVSSDCEASVQHEDAAVCPGSEETSTVWWWLERGVILLESNVHVLERRRRRGRRANGEGQSMGLVVVVVGILADDDDFDIVKGGMTGPEKHELDILQVQWHMN